MFKRLFLMFLVLMMRTAFGEQPAGSLSGFVYDASNGEALIGATVYLKKTGHGSSTNLSGYFVLPRVPAGEYVLEARLLGYKTHSQEISLSADEQKTIQLRLVPEALELQAVVVSAEKQEVSEQLYDKQISGIELSARQINAIPQVAEADLLRSLQTLPGIVPLSDFSSALYVRGGTPDQNLYQIDGADVYNPQHAFGIFSTFNTDAIKHVELSKGGFGAEYGDRLSSVLHVTHLDGNREEFEGSASLSLLSAKTTLQMPLGRSGSLSGSIRRTYFDQTIAKAIDDVPDYYFYDGNFKAFFDLNANNKLMFSAYGGQDFLDLTFNQKATDQAGIQYDWGNKTGSVRWTRIFSPALFANFWVTGSRFTSNFLLADADVTEENDIYDLTLKGSLQFHHSHQFITAFGFEQKNLQVIYKQIFPSGEVDVESKPRQYSAYWQTTWLPSSEWEVEAGLRYNFFKSDSTYQNLAPRLALKYRLNDNSSLKAAGGIYKQYLQRIPRFFVADIWTIADKYNGESTAQHAILGYQREIRNDFQFELELFYKNYQDILTYNYNLLTELKPSRYNEDQEPVYTETNGIFNRGDGNTLGLELLVRKDVGMINGWLGYSFSRTRYEFDEINKGEVFSPRHDRSHTINLVSNIDLKSALKKLFHRPASQARGNLSLGVNFVYSTGQPITEPGSGYFIASDPAAPGRSLEFAPTRINHVHLPYYGRLDLSLTWHKHYKSWSMSPYIQVFNVGNRKNVWFVDYQSTNGLMEVDEVNMFPLLPTIGVNFKF
ncbi:MAG: TonB-dependent receptor [bacterium]